MRKIWIAMCLLAPVLALAQSAVPPQFQQQRIGRLTILVENQREQIERLNRQLVEANSARIKAEGDLRAARAPAEGPK